jgi:rSAM/selenodomain-associated transferase 1
VAILVFARAPIAGAAKTRLIPELGAQDAALLHARMMQRVLLTAARAGIGPIQLWCTPSVTHAFFQQCERDAGVTLHAQHGHSLGERMHSAHDAAFGTFTRILLIGTDCPVLDESHLRAAALALDDHDAVLIPADDGGYVLLGLSRPCPEVFQAIDWGSDRVLEQTIARLQDAGMRHFVAPPLWDIDRPEDLRRLARCLPELLDGLGKTSVSAGR